MTDFKKQGRKNRASGGRFELKVRHDLENKRWVVSKWSNNVELSETLVLPSRTIKKGWLMPAKRKFNPFNRVLTLGTGFPDFIAYQLIPKVNGTEVIGVEVKSNGYLDKEEKEKCKWLLDNNIFSRILIAKKGKKRGEIEYIEWKEN